MRKLLLLLFMVLSAVAWGQDSALIKKDTPWVLYHRIEAQLDTVFDDNRAVSYMIEPLQQKYGYESKQMDSVFKIMHVVDSINIAKVKAILDTYGWLGIDEIGEKANMALFLVIQRSDSLTQVTYLPMMLKAVKDGKAKAIDLAHLEDRVLTRQGKPQLYGTQLRRSPRTGHMELFPIQDERNVNKRRAEVGLRPLEESVRMLGIDYHLPN